MRSPWLLILFCCLIGVQYAAAQQSPQSPGGQQSFAGKLINLPTRFTDDLQRKTEKLGSRLTKQTEKYLQRLARQEKKLQRQLQRKDSAAAANLFAAVPAKYQELQEQINKAPARLNIFRNVYSSRLDSQRTALHFLQDNNLTEQSAPALAKLKGTLEGLDGLQGKLNQTEAIRQYLVERRRYLQQQLQQWGLAKEMKRFRQEVAYYQIQLTEYKQLLEEPSKLEEKLLGVLRDSKLFRDFFNKHADLAGLFRLPGNGSSTAGPPMAGLQTRASLQQELEQRLGAGPNVNELLQQNVQAAQPQLNQLKNKLKQLGNGADPGMPDFKPRSTRTKTFLQRLELGSNIQNTRSNNFFPAITDLCLSAGYKLNDKSVAGIGLSGKIGWGKDIRHIDITGSGFSIRSFIDVQFKGSFYLSGGFEYHYQQPFSTIQEINKLNYWQPGGVAGLSKIVSLRSKLLKKTKMTLLWDFLSYQQVPRTQALKFRVGYTWH